MLYTAIVARRGQYDLAGRDAEFVELTWQQRQKRRIRAVTDRGREVGILLPEGGLLQDGDLLGPGDPPLVVRAAPEPVLVIWPRTREEMGRVAHQIGNRHIQAWITEEAIVVLDDPVLSQQLQAAGVPHRREVRPLAGSPVPPPAGGHHHHDDP